MHDKEIEELKNRITEELMPQRIYLFGSYADGTYTDESDYDFYVVVNDDAGNLVELASKAYAAIGNDRKKPVDILIGRITRFEEMKNLPTVENEVYMKGVLLYGKAD